MVQNLPIRKWIQISTALLALALYPLLSADTTPPTPPAAAAPSGTPAMPNLQALQQQLQNLGTSMGPQALKPTQTPPTGTIPTPPEGNVPNIAKNDNATDGDNPDSAIDIPAPTNKVSMSQGTNGENLLSVDFPDEAVRTAVRNIADLYDLSVVIPTELQGRTSIRLKNVTWQDAYKSILEPIKYTFVLDNNIVKIVSAASLAANQPIENAVLTVIFGQSTNIAKSITSILSSNGSANAASNPTSAPTSDVPTLFADAITNTIVVRGTKSQIDMVRTLAKNLDTADSQIMIESKIIYLTDSDVMALGFQWSTFVGDTSAASKYTIHANDAIYPDMTQATTTASTTYAGKSGLFSLEKLTGWGKNRAAWSSNRANSVVFNADDFNVAIRALNTLTNTKLVSNPTVVTMNNQEATIKSVSQYPIAKYEINSTTGATQIDGFDYKDIGITLKVKPTVKEKYVTLQVDATDSEDTKDMDFGSGESAQKVPLITTRSAVTNVTLQSGYTLALGGLMQDSLNKTVAKVPFLGDLPLLGFFFRNKTDQFEKDNLIIFLTATQIGYDGTILFDASPGVRNLDPVKMHDLKMSTSELPGYMSTGAERARYEEVQRLRDQVSQKVQEKSLRKEMVEIQGDKYKVAKKSLRKDRKNRRQHND